MSAQERRERERAQRERLIITTARDLAEADGWDAVTTRRLAELIEYSQPVLYSHFKGKDAIMAAVALDGFAELAAQLRATRSGAAQSGAAQSGAAQLDAAPTARAGLAAVVSAYFDFAERHPALYDAMFVHAVDLPFAHPETPAAMLDAFGAIRDALPPLTGDDDLDLHAEVLWAGLHGLVTLMRGDRLPRETHERRVALLLDRFAA